MSTCKQGRSIVSRKLTIVRKNAASKKGGMGCQGLSNQGITDLFLHPLLLGFGKRGLLEKGFPENLEILEILENSRLWKIKENPTIF